MQDEQENQEHLDAEQTPADEATTEEAANGDQSVEALQVQLEEAQAQVLYIKAEGENIRRRAAEDVDKARKFALEKFSGELLSVKDSLDAALATETEEVQSYKDGVELTSKQLLSVFEKFNITELNPVEETFDPNLHQAIQTVESDQQPNTVVSVLQKGYTLNDRVLRPALVVVSKAK